ncbi:MAG: S8 family serine peptidase [Planctomycetia bacterium]
MLTLWDQNGGNSPASPFGYGVEYSAASLDLAINQADPYTAIGYFPEASSHGTHVMDIAAGNGIGSGTPGMAPNADLIFVNVTHEKDPTKPQNVVGTSFGDSVTLLEALKYIFDKAGSRPTVVNVSLGTNGGPHDGTTLVDQGIDALVGAAPNRAVVISAANSHDDGIHAAGMVTAGGAYDLTWDLASTLFRPIELELWYAGADRFKVELYGPNGALLATASSGETKQVVIGTTLVALVANRLNDPNNHDNMIGVFLAAGMPGGAYTVRLTGEVVSNGRFHAWIERDNSFQSSFPASNDNTHTIGSISCGRNVIAVGSYDASTASKPLSYFSSAGPTRDGRKKPEISAPGHNIWAAKSLSKTGVTRMSGTSMASPCVAGIIALMFAEAAARGVKLTIEQTIQIITGTARRNPPGGTAWHDRYGHGRISAAKAVKAVIDMGGGTTSGAASSMAPKPRKRKQ